MDPIRVAVGLGTCGVAAGAREVIQGLLDELRDRPDLLVEIERAGCVGLCEWEPMVTVRAPGAGPVVYCRVDADKARRIVREHLAGGRPVTEWLLPEGQQP
ncbi:MAG: (2Fe-2S) ferredoxin domain-containing protein [bacterium]|nr:(2Fe-2S) ferredoxin domain-containing protein [bacterium]